MISGEFPAHAAIAHRTYSALVQADDDLVGHVAYALYKRDKLKFCESVRASEGRLATQEEIATFIRACNLDTTLQGYRSQAELLLERMTEYQLEDAIAAVEAHAKDDLLQQLKQARSWSRSVAEALLGSVAVALMWAALILIVYGNRIGFARLMKDVLGFGST